MRKLIFLLIPLMFLVLPFTSQSGEEDSLDIKPAVYGILMYADWCGTCKALDPKIAQARKEANLDQEDILFLRWDLTDELTSHQAEMMAAVLGLGDLYNENAGKTGFMLLVDADSGEKLAQLTMKHEATDIAEKIQASIESVKS